MATASDKLVERNAHIPTAEIELDIIETEREIARMEVEAAYLADTPHSMPEARWNHMKADARRTGIKERQEFIRKLKLILTARSADAVAVNDETLRGVQTDPTPGEGERDA